MSAHKLVLPVRRADRAPAASQSAVDKSERFAAATPIAIACFGSPTTSQRSAAAVARSPVTAPPRFVQRGLGSPRSNPAKYICFSTNKYILPNSGTGILPVQAGPRRLEARTTGFYIRHYFFVCTENIKHYQKIYYEPKRCP